MLRSIWETFTGNYHLLLSLAGIGITAIGFDWYFRKQAAVMTDKEIEPKDNESSFGINLQENTLSKAYQSIYTIKTGAIAIPTCDLYLAPGVEIAESLIKSGEVITIQRESESFKISFLKKEESSQEIKAIDTLVVSKNQLPTLSELEFDGQILDKNSYQDVYEQIYALVNAQRGYINKLSHFLGKGNFGEVWKAHYRDKAVALKEIDFKKARYNLKSEEEAMEDFEWELSRLSTLSHPNIVQFYGIYQQSNKTYLVMKYCAAGSLEKVLQKQPTWAMRWQWALETTQAVAYLHHQGVIHRDLKAENILIDENNCARLADLGVAQVDVFLEQQESTSVNLGSQDIRFIAPERMGHHTVSSPKTDIYALGLVLWQLATGKIPREPTRKIFAEAEREPIPEDCPSEIRQLILDCWRTNPEDRPSAEEVVTRLKRMEFNEFSSLIQLCEEVDIEIHPARIEGLKYLPSYLTEHQVLEDLDTYWQRLEMQPDFEGNLSRQEISTPSQLGNPPFSLHKTLNEFLAQEEANSLVLLGESGLGKTLSTYQLADRLLSQWWNYLKNPVGTMPYYPLFIRSKLSQWSHSELVNAMDKIFKIYGENEALLKGIPVLVIVDAYDECQADIPPENLPKQMGLNDLPHVKLLVTCRSNTVENSALSARFALNGRLTVRYFLPFHTQQMLCYLKESLNWAPDTYQHYQEIIIKATELRQVLRNPFVLSLLVQSWETTVSKKDLTQLNRWQIYQGFTEHWIKSRQFLLLPSIQETLSQGHEDLLDSFNAFAAEIAFETFKEKDFSFNLAKDRVLSPNSRFWLNLEKEIEEHTRKAFAVRQGNQSRSLLNEIDYITIMHLKLKQFEVDSPLKRRALSFDPSHKSFLEYFIARRIIELRRKDPRVIFKEGLQLLNIRSLQEEPETLRLMVEAWHEPETYKLQKPFIDIILASKEENPNVSQAASNAITFLNAARVSFSGMDLSRIRIPGADLSYGIFDRTDLSGTNLHKVKLAGAWLREVDFSSSIMEEVYFGELPYLKLSEPINVFCYSQNENQLALGSENTIVIYETKTRKLIKILKVHLDSVTAITFISPRGKWLAYGSGDNTIRLWETESGASSQVLEGHNAPITALACNPIRQQLASGGSNYQQGNNLYSDNVIRLWEITNGERWSCIKILEGHLDTVRILVFNPNGSQLASGSNDNTIRLWNTENGICSNILNEHTNWVTTLAYRPDGRELASASGAYIANFDYAIRLWEIKDEVRVSRILEGHSFPVTALTYSPDGAKLASGSYDNTIRLWDHTGACIRILAGNKQSINTLAYSTDGKQLTSSSGEYLRFWEIGMFYNKTSTGPITMSSVIAYSLDRQQIAFECNGYGIQILKISNGKQLNCIQNLKGHTGKICILSYNMDKQLISASFDKTVRFWNADNGVCIKILTWDTYFTRPIAYSRNRNQLAFSTFNTNSTLRNCIKIWDLNSETYSQILDIQATSIKVLEYNSDGTQLAHDSEYNTILLWKLEERGEWIHSQILEGHTGSITTLAFSPNGKQLASGSNDNTILLWKLEERGEWIHSQILEGHTGSITTLTFSPNGKQLASGSYDNTVRFWEVEDQMHDLSDIIIRQKKHGINFLFNVSDMHWIQTEEGNYLITQGSDSSIRYWHIVNLETDITNIQLIWSNNQIVLFSIQAHIDNVQGLSLEKASLLEQKDIGNLTEPEELEAKKAITETILKVKLIVAASKGDAEAQYRLGLYYEEKQYKNNKKSAKWYIKAAQQHHAGACFKVNALSIDLRVKIYLELADEAITEHDLKKTIYHYEMALEFNPQLQYVQHNLGCYYHVQSQLENNPLLLHKAENCFQQAMKLSHSSDIRTEFANFLFIENRHEEAINLLIQAIQLREDNESLTYDNEMEIINLPDELKVELNSQNVITVNAAIFAYYLLGFIYKIINQESKFSMHLLEYAREVKKTQEPLNYALLGYTYKKYGFFNEAALYFNEAYNLGKNYFLAKKNRDECERLRNEYKEINDVYMTTAQLKNKEVDVDPELGPREILNFHLRDENNKGNGFYEALADQMQLINHSFINTIPFGTTPYDSLRLAMPTQQFFDQEWNAKHAIDEFAKRFDDIILAVIDTRRPQRGFFCYYVEGNTVTTNTGEISLPNKLILRVAATGNYFLSVRRHPELAEGCIHSSFNDLGIVLPSFEPQALTWMRKFDDEVRWQQWKEIYNEEHLNAEKNGYGPGAIIISKKF